MASQRAPREASRRSALGDENALPPAARDCPQALADNKRSASEAPVLADVKKTKLSVRSDSCPYLQPGICLGRPAVSGAASPPPASVLRAATGDCLRERRPLR